MSNDADDSAPPHPADTATAPADEAGHQYARAPRPARAAEPSSESSTEAELPASASQSRSAAPLVGAARLAALRECIASGGYRIDAKRIAQRMLEVEGNL